MKTKGLLVLLAMVLVVSLAAFVACKAEEEAPPVVEEEAPPVVEEEAPPVEPPFQWPDKLLFGASSIQSPGYASAVGWTTPFAKDTGVQVRVVI